MSLHCGVSSTGQAGDKDLGVSECDHLCLPLLSWEHGAMQTLPIYLGVGRAHTGSLEDLIYPQSLDAKALEK